MTRWSNSVVLSPEHLQVSVKLGPKLASEGATVAVGLGA